MNDNKLLITFENYLRKSNNEVKAVKEFIYGLLYCKYLFDQYILKREFAKGEDGWSLKRLKWIRAGRGRNGGRCSYQNTFGVDDEDSGNNRRILMLLSAFHVSTPTMVYKYWLNAALHYLYRMKNRTISANNYRTHLESVAKAFLFDRLLAPDEGKDYFEIIVTNKGACQVDEDDVSNDDLDEKLSFGQVENLVFNYLDYLLWVKNENLPKKNKKISNYEFTFRSSVEHYYPQNPMPGHDILPAENIHSFGNLCLISHSKNSRLSNFMPEAKKEYYKNNTIDSIKQSLMMEFEKWNVDSIKEHNDKMREILVASL